MTKKTDNAGAPAPAYDAAQAPADDAAQAPDDGAPQDPPADATPQDPPDDPPPPPPVAEEDAAPERIDLAAIYADFGQEAISNYKKVDKALPAGDRFSVRFDPVDKWKRGIGGFDIRGLERSKFVRGSAELDRNEMVLSIMSIAAPGDVELCDIVVMPL